MKHATLQFSQDNKCQEYDDEKNDGDSDTHQDGGVVWVGGDGQGPRGLTELVHCCVGSDLTN